MIYVSHPYGGLEENKLRIEEIIRELQRLYPEEIFVSPVHCFGFLYDIVDYECGLNMCLELLCRCDSMLVFGNYMTSTGCKAEVKFAVDKDIPYAIVSEQYDLKKCSDCTFCGRCRNEEGCMKLINATNGAKIEETLKTIIYCANYIDLFAVGDAMCLIKKSGEF